MKKSLTALSAALLILTGCSGLYDPTPKPDYTIKVVPTANGMAAVPPECPAWSGPEANPYDNQIMPQIGCASARNLALMVENPNDLIHGRDIGPASGVTTVGAIRRYNANQTRGLLDTGSSPDMSIAVTTSSSSASALSGEAAGGSGGAPAAAAPAAP